MDDTYKAIGAMLAMLFFVVYLSRLYRRYRLRHYEVPVRDIRKGHRWFMMDLFTEPTYCNISGYHIIHGARCDSCGISVYDHSMRAADKKFKCKQVCIKGEVMHHQWIPGNLPLCSVCDVCGEDCGNSPELCDRRCCWCQRTVHDDCTPSTDICDMGANCKEIVPPNCLELKWVGLKGRKHLIVKSVRKPSIPEWSPLIVIANRKSGNNDGEHVLQAFRAILNPAQVIDLHDIPPESGLEWCHLLPLIPVRVLVCGGDGTIGWVLKSIEKLQFKKPPRVCILPLGTGNDLSRVLGWGEGYTGDVQVTDVLSQLKKAHPVALDRWKVEISHEKHFGISVPKLKRVMMMNNYASIGVDALVTLNFHKRRESWPWLFANRLINKFAYFTYGTKDVLERECKQLNKKMRVELDDRVLELPDIEGIVILNISSWGGGCRPWELASDDLDFKPASYDDGLLEVMALYSSFHIAQLQVGLAAPFRLGQARKVKISLHGGKAPMQLDGEPWEQLPAEIIITHHSQAAMMAIS
ncbi:diacylglycerol kinase epsilon-like [Haliotis rubra]|uniref:diacylglycerol kinase epsilon-like n=1 Tax=Haliotis rubra TaxID=36100 RepID=UPI001EE5134E|nr:diacylglycerol kinase epsilon-like [Haliotis rubra]